MTPWPVWARVFPSPGPRKRSHGLSPNRCPTIAFVSGTLRTSGGHPHEVGERISLHLSHHLAAMGLHGDFARFHSLRQWPTALALTMRFSGGLGTARSLEQDKQQERGHAHPGEQLERIRISQYRGLPLNQAGQG